jgi:tetratricopeptide (TPR) repeat protein
VEPAEEHYLQALALADELGMRPLVAHCHRGLGTLYATIGQWEQARAELSTAIELYRTMDMTFWLPQVEAALAQVNRGGQRREGDRVKPVTREKSLRDPQSPACPSPTDPGSML